MAGRQLGAYVTIAVGFGLMRVSKSLELQGDLATASGDRLGGHLAALVVLLIAGGCFVRGGVLLYRNAFGPKPQSDAQQVASVFADSEPEFDADAALARYTERKRAEPPAPIAPRSGGFGRKGL